MKIVIGIDPGVSGAVAVIDSEGRCLSVHDMPTVMATKTSDRQKVDAYGLSKIVRQAKAVAGDAEVIAAIEYVQPMPSSAPEFNPRTGETERRSMPAAYAFAFGKSAGIPEGIIAALEIRLEFVTPQVWKRHFGLGKDKEHARALAIRTWPSAELNLKRHHNRAEALLIAKCMADRLLLPAAATVTS